MATKRKKLDPSQLIDLKKKMEKLIQQEERLRQQILADLGALVVSAITANWGSPSPLKN